MLAATPARKRRSGAAASDASGVLHEGVVHTGTVDDLGDLYDREDATGLAHAIRTGEVKAHEVVELALGRIEERNPTVNAVSEVRASAALAEADSVGAGALAGVPFVTKDLGIDVAGMRSTGGSRLFADVVARDDSMLVQRYRAAGLILVATTSTPELGRAPSTEPLLRGPTRNPHRLTHSSGGSSGGTAAAVASGMVPAGHGNDGGGSIRIPASACGLVGLKPSRGRTPALPRLTALSYPMGINHALTRSVRDTALLLDVSSAPLIGDAFVARPPARPYVDEVGASPGRLRVAVSTMTPDGSPTHPECVAATDDAARLLESLGHDVTVADPPYPLDAVQHAMRVVMTAPMAFDVDTRLDELGRGLADDDLEPFTRMLYDLGKRVTGTEYVAALRDVERAGHVMGAFFEDHDILLTPTLPAPPPELGVLDVTDLGAMIGHAGPFSTMTSVANVTGQPAISLPLARFHDGLPLGIQLTAATGREDLLVRLASQVESARPWPTAPVWPPPTEPEQQSEETA
jgi:amidase